MNKKVFDTFLFKIYLNDNNEIKDSIIKSEYPIHCTFYITKATPQNEERELNGIFSECFEILEYFPHLPPLESAHDINKTLLSTLEKRYQIS